MLIEKAYNNPVSGVWETFERERGRLSLQGINIHNNVSKKTDKDIKDYIEKETGNS